MFMRNPSIGDSVIITGTIAEYYGKTELIEITDYLQLRADYAMKKGIQHSILAASMGLLLSAPGLMAADTITGCGRSTQW